ncbi:MAG: hypothetical protein ACJAXJ_003311 [Colwellia sp.]|jgi:hypothetical protein
MDTAMENSQNTTLNIKSPLLESLMAEALAMADYVLSNGINTSSKDIALLHQLSLIPENKITSEHVEQLAKIHLSFSQIITPATPNGISYVFQEKQKKSFGLFLGAVPIIRYFTAITLLLLMSMIALGLSPNVNYTTISKGILASEGITLLLNLLFILTCAGLGACFSQLYQLNLYISNTNYDPKFDSTYWVRLILGIISGLFLVELLPPELFQSDGKNNLSQQFGKPAMAMVGGFSATMVYTILQRVVDTLESLVKSDQKSLVLLQKQQSKVTREIDKQEIKSGVAGQLMSIDQHMNSDPDKAKKILKDTISQLLPDSNS